MDLGARQRSCLQSAVFGMTWSRLVRLHGQFLALGQCMAHVRGDETKTERGGNQRGRHHRSVGIENHGHACAGACLRAILHEQRPCSLQLPPPRHQRVVPPLSALPPRTAEIHWPCPIGTKISFDRLGTIFGAGGAAGGIFQILGGAVMVYQLLEDGGGKSSRACSLAAWLALRAMAAIP